MGVKYYDIGLNLFCKQFPDPKKIWEDARKEGISCIFTGTNRKENIKIHDFTKKYGGYGTVGIHPHHGDDARQEDFELIEKIVKENEKIVAIGECGLDYDRMFSTKENQIRCLEKHIGITGWICDDRRAKALREGVSFIPLDRILIETDAPYLTPKNVPGLNRTNIPQNIRYVVKDLAKYMKVSEDVLMENAKKNTERIFQIKE